MALIVFAFCIKRFFQKISIKDTKHQGSNPKTLYLIYNSMFKIISCFMKQFALFFLLYGKKTILIKCCVRIYIRDIRVFVFKIVSDMIKKLFPVLTNFPKIFIQK